MRVAIWGASENGIKLADKLSESIEYSIECFVDNKEINSIQGYRVLSAEELLEKQQVSIEAIIIAARRGDSIFSIVDQIRAARNIKIGVARPSYVDYGIKQKVVSEDAIFWISDHSKPILWYVQAILTTKCNLNCRGCTHFANLFIDDQVEDRYHIDFFKRDIDILAKNTEVFRIRLMGGEPLLINNLHEYIEYTREKLPRADISIVTNGLLLPSLNEKVLLIISKTDTNIQISEYPPTVKIRDKIDEVMRKFGLHYSYVGMNRENGVIDSFWKNIDLRGENDATSSMRICPSHGCTTLHNGLLYKCSIDMFMPKFMEYFDINKSIGEDRIKIDADNMNWGKVIRNIYENPVDTCRYCSTKLEKISWEQKKEPMIDDWVVGE